MKKESSLFFIVIALALYQLLVGQNVLASACDNPNLIYCNDFESMEMRTWPSGPFSIPASNGVRCDGVGENSSCSYSNLIQENYGIPPYPGLSFPRRTETTFIRFSVKTPEYYFLPYGSHTYYVYDSARSGSIAMSGGYPGSIGYDPMTHIVSTRGSGYQRVSNSFEGYDPAPNQRGRWHSYQLMIIPSNQDPNVGRIKVWVNGKLALFTKTDTIPSFNTFWISNYHHSLEYHPKDNFANMFESFTAPLHPAFEFFLDNLMVSSEFIEIGNDQFQIERVRFFNLSSTSFNVAFDSTVKAIGKVEWGETMAYGNQAVGLSPGYFHNLSVSNLQIGKTYFLKISATDATGRNVSSTITFNTNGALPDFLFPDWKGEIYQNLNLSGTPIYVRNFKSLNSVNWAPQNSDDIVRTDQNMSVRYTKRQYFPAGTYSVRVLAYDGLRVIVNGQVKVNQPNQTQGWNKAWDFNITLSEGIHDLEVQHIIYRDPASWEATISKGLSFSIEPQVKEAPRLISQYVYNTKFYLPDQPFYAARCDKPCKVVIDYGLTPSYGQQLIATSGDGLGTAVSTVAYNRFPSLIIGATYYYRVTLSDNFGNTRVLPTQTFTVGDTIPPQQVTSLSVSRLSSDSLRLTFRAPGDDGRYGRAVQYDLRYSQFPLTLQNWEQAIKIMQVPTPQLGGTTETINLNGFPSGPTYYFGIRAIDSYGNVGLLSNIASNPPGPQILDLDGDGYGLGSALGGDCDDQNPAVYQISKIYLSGYCMIDNTGVISPSDTTPPAPPTGVTII